MRCIRGFTLVELLVVLAISALLVGLAPMAFDRLRDSANYRDALRGIMMDMRAARQQAIVSRVETSFVVDLERRSYRVDGQQARNIPEPLEIRVTMAGEEANSREGAGIRFFPGGGATGGSVDILRPSGEGARLRIDWLSGRVALETLTP